MGISPRKRRSTLFVAVMAMLVLAVFAGCGGDTKTVTETTTVTRTVPTPAPTQQQIQKLRARCRVQVVSTLLRGDKTKMRALNVRPAFFCSSTRVRIQRDLPLSPFAAKDECRLDYDIDVTVWGNPSKEPPIDLGPTWRHFSSDCRRIRFVLYSTSDEFLSFYRPDAPLTEGALRPGQKAQLQYG